MCLKPVLQSLSRKEPHHFGGDGAANRWGSGSERSGSKLDVQHSWILIKCHELQQFFTFPFTFTVYNKLNRKKSEEKIAPNLYVNFCWL
jgi:hypothetical protein